MKHRFTFLFVLVVLAGFTDHLHAQDSPIRPSSSPITTNGAARLRAPQASTIRYVKAGATGTGVSWSNASGDLQAMINAAASGDQVWIAGGTYKPNTTGLADARRASFLLKDGVSVLGGFTGASGTEGNANARTAIPSSTTLSGDIGTPEDASDNTFHVVTSNFSTALDGVAITGGNANGPDSDDTGFGGGIISTFGTPRFTNCQFSRNYAGNGGAIDNLNTNGAQIINCSFQNNSSRFAAGVYDESASNTAIINCFFSQNTEGFRAASSTNTILTNCTFSGNTPSISPASAIGSQVSSVNLINSLLWNNSGQNAIVLVIGGTVTASYCLIESGETTYTDGGHNQALTSSPFANATGPELTKCAPAVDAGNDAANTTTTDVLGNDRKRRTIDIGAAEYQGTLYIAPAISNLSQSATTVCQGSQVTFGFDFTTSSDGITAAYLYRDNTNLGDAVLTAPPRITGQFRRSFSINQSGSYQIVAVSTCSSVTTTYAPITVNPLPTAYNVTGGGAYCTGESGVVVGLSGSQTGVTYQLLRGGSSVTTVAGTGNAISFGSQTQAGTYTVQATSTTGSCQQTMTGSASVSVNTPPAVSITPSATAICAGQTATFTASGDPASYSWSSGQTTASISATAQGAYTVTATSNGCSSTATAQLTVNPLPTPTIVGLASAYCKDAAAVTLMGSPAGGSPARGVFTVDGTTTPTFNPASLSVGQHTVVYSYTNASGCSATASQVVTVKEVPQTPAITTQPGGSYPSGQSNLTISQNTGNVILGVSGCSGGTITWSGGNSNTLSVSTANTGTQTFTATCTSNGCTSPLATATVTVVAPTLRVFSRDPDNGQLGNNTIKPYLQLQNVGTTPINYSTITVRYWLTTENNIPLLFQKNYIQIGQGNVQIQYVPLATPRQGATGYIEYNFSAGAGSLAPNGNSGPIETQINKQNYTAFNQLDDYSYINNSAYTLNPRITAYQNGVIFYGTEPGPGSPRLAASEPVLGQLSVRVLGNPVTGSQAQVEITGVEGQAVNLSLTDLQGKAVHQQQIPQAGTIERVDVPVEGAPGILLLQVATPTQRQQIKLVKP